MAKSQTRLVRVALSNPIFEPLTYGYEGEPGTLLPGQRVVVPLMNRVATGWVVAADSQYFGRVKNIVGVIQDPFIPQPGFLDFVQAVAAIYFTSAGILLDSAVSPKTKNLSAYSFLGEKGIEKYKSQSLKELNALCQKGPLAFFLRTKQRGEEEGSVFTKPMAVPESPIPDKPESCFLISLQRLGFYVERIQQVLASNRSVLILVPDNFTAAYMQETLGQQGVAVDVFNSELKMAERDRLWQAYVREGKVGVLCGGVSAALLPFGNPGLIIVERAGCASYRRRSYSPYYIPLLGQLRARYQSVPLIEGFSTYTVSAYEQKLTTPPLDQRKTLAPVNVFMIPGGLKGIPDNLVELVTRYYLEQKKVLLLVNRKESRDFLYCGKCKKTITCPQCEGVLEPGSDFRVTCTQCGFTAEHHSTCPRCSEPLTLVQDISMASLARVLSGRVVETGISLFSAEEVKLADLPGLRQQVAESAIVIGTPLLLNPFFSGVFGAVIYVRPETYVNLEEYDAAERVFALVAEMRELLTADGQVDIFSTFHFFYSLKLANDEAAFFERELKYRQWFRLPPYAYIYHLEIRGKNLRELARQMRELYRNFKESLGINKIFLQGRKPFRGVWKGIIEAHAKPQAIRDSGVLANRDISISLVLN